MLTRRDVLKSGMAAGVAGLLGSARTASAAAPQPLTKVSFDVPPGACDCHVHVFGDPKKYPFFAGRTYTPEIASVDELRQLLSALRLERVVIVQPSVYGTDNSCTLDGMRELGNRARGVAVIDDKTTDAQLDAMGKAGIRGIRLNLATAGINDPSAARQRFDNAVARVRNRGWHIQFNTQLTVIEALSPQLLASPVPLVIDHFGGAIGRARPRTARLRRARESGEVGESVREDFRQRRFGVDATRSRRRRAARARVGRRQPAAHSVGHELAPSRDRRRSPAASPPILRFTCRPTMEKC